MITRMRQPARARIIGRPTTAEIKCFDCVITAGNLVAYSAPPVFAEPAAAFAGYTVLNKVQQGAGYYERIGSKVVFTSVSLDGELIASAVTPQTDIRVCVIYDRQANGAAPAFADVFYSQPAGATAFTSGLNMTNRSRFAMVADRYFTMDTAQSLVQHIKIFSKGRYETEFKATGNTIGDIATGAFLLFIFYGTQVGAGTISFSNAVARMRYMD